MKLNKKLAGLLVATICLYALSVVFNKRPVDSSKYGSIVRLVSDGKTFCSGTVINNHTVLTAAHCIVTVTPFGPMTNEDIEVRPSDNTDLKIHGQPYYATIQLDQGLIAGDFSKFESRSHTADVKKLVDSRFTYYKTCGYPMGGPLYCNTLHYKNLTNFMWSVDGVLIAGMSGGPVMLSDGTVVAVNVAVEGDRAVVSPIYNIDEYMK
jgi:V8-like Glu-specific endopeptidase